MPILSEFQEFPINIKRSSKYNWTYTGSIGDKYRHFAPALNTAEYGWHMKVISIFKRIIEANNITYLLTSGTLIGAYRHHRFVPWDADFDVFCEHLAEAASYGCP